LHARGRRRRRIPAPLLGVIATAVVAAIAWTCALPPVQGPDEDSHVAYVQRVAETRSIPWKAVNPPPADPGLPYSTEFAYAQTYGLVTPSWGNPFGRPARTEADERIWESQDATLPPDAGADGGFTPAMNNPPLYYVYDAIPYAIASAGSMFDRVFVIRLGNLPALIAIVAFTWLIAGELFGRRQWLQTLATLAVALQPQLLHMTAVVNPDVFLAALWTAALYVMTIIVKRGPTRGRLAWLSALTVASCLTQGRGLAILLPVAVVVGLLGWRQSRSGTRRRLAVAAMALAAAAGLATLVYYAVGGDLSVDRVRQFTSYVWQFYLPQLGFMDPSISPGYGVGELFDRFVGGFGMLEATFPRGALRALKITALVVALLAIVGMIVRRHDVRRRLDLVIVYAAAAIGYLALLHAAAFRSLLSTSDPVITGRYLLPLLPVYGAAIALAVSWLPRRWAPVAGGVAVSSVLLLQMAAFGVLFARWYA
jgi:4-amino-4-deoxy-L-arabinose transferase-like glycosyltransferase